MTSSRVKSEDGNAAILVVDDHTFNLELMEGLLYREGYRVLTAPDAETALSLFRKEPVDLAILDVMMPGMNGFDLCRKLKSMADRRFFPVVLVTALSQLDDKITGLEAGADDFLTKPFHTIELLTKVRSLLRLKKLQNELDHSEDVILTLAIAIEARDPYTKGHSERVGSLSTELGAFFGMSGNDQDSLFKAGVLHDIGKLGIEDRILHKAENLSEQEALLGLALTRRLVDLHGGQIHARSVYGEGSQFTFYLPATPPEAEKETAETFESLPIAFPWVADEAPLVLVVEDDLPTSEILTIHLGRAGYRVAHAYDGVEAISKAKELMPFAITLDVMLPKKDGWEVLQALKAGADTRDIPVIIHSIVDNKDLAYALGASDYLMKPVDKTSLIGKLGELSLFTRRGLSPVSLLLISGDRETLDYVAEMFKGNGVLVHSALSTEEGMELAAATRPAMILIDLGTCGFESIKRLKATPSTTGIPIFALTNKDLSLEERLDLTGQIERIFRKDSLVAQDLIMHLKDVEILHPKRAGLIDDLTGLFNHRYFQLRLAQEVNRAVRYKTPLTLILLDVDYFGHYVKEKGAYHGNLVLRKIAELLRRNIRGSDIVVRYGADAFSVLLPNTLIAQGVTLGGRFHAIIRDYPFLHEEIQPKGRLTVSVGVAAFKAQTPEELIKCSELALAKALQKGGAAVEVYENLG
jgi:diguanylate cyclase (GGDEF)-like protein